ncbi:hypothetical protein TNCV_690301 [Trichonephila clavipes]|nr:hypothetical protein TNCV_690301 [Trichonephila clavipes]
MVVVFRRQAVVLDRGVYLIHQSSDSQLRRSSLRRLGRKESLFGNETAPPLRPRSWTLTQLAHALKRPCCYQELINGIKAQHGNPKCSNEKQD